MSDDRCNCPPLDDVFREVVQSKPPCPVHDTEERAAALRGQLLPSVPVGKIASVLPSDPGPDAEQVTVPGIDRFVVRDVILALRARGFPVGPVDALRYAEERLLEDANVEAAAKADYELTEGDEWSIGKVPMEEASVWLDSARAVLIAAFRSARGEGT